MTYNQQNLSDKLNQRVSILINGSKYPKNIVGTITGFSNIDLTIRLSGINNHITIKYSQIVDVSTPETVFDLDFIGHGEK